MGGEWRPAPGKWETDGRQDRWNCGTENGDGVGGLVGGFNMIFLPRLSNFAWPPGHVAYQQSGRKKEDITIYWLHARVLGNGMTPSFSTG